MDTNKDCTAIGIQECTDGFANVPYLRLVVAAVDEGRLELNILILLPKIVRVLCRGLFDRHVYDFLLLNDLFFLNDLFDNLLHHFRLGLLRYLIPRDFGHQEGICKLIRNKRTLKVIPLETEPADISTFGLEFVS